MLTTASAQDFLSRWGLEPTAVAREGCLLPSPSPGSGLPWSCCRQAAAPHRKARGPWTSTKEEPANDRPSPRSVLVQTSTRPSAAPGCQAGFRQQLATAGPLPFKTKEFVPTLSERGTVLVLRITLQAPEVMLDDAEQARPGRLRPQRLRRAPKVPAPLRPATCTPYGAAAVGYH